MGTRYKPLIVPSKKETLYLSAEEISSWQPASAPDPDKSLRTPLLNAIKANKLDNPMQIAGHHFAVGCVALEITQRCNLDCTACYLSDYSEAVHDIPLEEVLRRIDLIKTHYGENTNVQITGGDPTLRNREELLEIVRYAAEQNLRPALFTNGIKATRTLLKDLKQVGLKDVAFHVDLTQERKGFATEADLNQVRLDYIQRAKGLGLQIIFNTTVFAGNLQEIPALSNFFANHAADIHLASFQMIADTGRGTERERADAITQDKIKQLIQKGVGTSLHFDFPQIGHLECNLYTKCLIAADSRTSAFNGQDRHFFEKLLPFTRTLYLNRHQPLRSLLHLSTRIIAGNLKLAAQTLGYGFRKAWALRNGLIKSRGKIDLITFYVHNFMHAHELNKERCETCVFMTMTRDGPVSMCVHNAKRDGYILQDIPLSDGSVWQPLAVNPASSPNQLPRKKLKGRLRQTQEKLRKNKTPFVEGLIGSIETKRRNEKDQISTY